MGIYEKLLAIQTGLKAPKGQRNSFGNYNYRSCEDILESVKPLCAKHQAVLWLSDELVNIGDRYYIKAIATLKDIESEAHVSTTAYAREEESKKGMDGSQVTGASSSYARKYAMNALFDIDDTKDSDATNKHGTDNSVSTDQEIDSSEFCADCGRQIEDHTTSKGKTYLKDNLIYSSRKNHSKSQCYACYWKEENAKKNDEA